MSIYFPSTIRKPDYPLEITYEDTSIQSSFEDGSVVSRSKFTRSRDTYKLTWTNLPKSEYDTLVSFIKNTIKFGAKQFLWAKPVAMSANAQTTEYVEVRLKSISDAKLNVLKLYNITIEIQEV